MSDDPSDRRDRSPTTASFEEWLDRQAESQGISRQELFERLVSSYWTLNELVQLLDDSGNTTSLADIYPDDDPDSPDGKGAAPTIGGSGRGSGDERPRDRDRQERRRRRREERDRRNEEVPELRTRIRELDDRIDDLESDLGNERERGQSQDGLIEALADRLSGIEADISELESESASARESLSDDQAALERRLDELESDLDGRQKQLASEQERLRSRLNSEFDDLETILRYLVSQTDDLDAGLATVEQRHDEALSQLQWEQEAMRSLLREASAHDAHVGECAVCGEQVNLDLLAEPYCSECNSLLTGIEERDKWLFFSDVVVTAEETPAAGRVASAADTGPSEPEPTPDSSGPPDTATGPGPESPRTPTEANTRRTGFQANDSEPVRSTADGHGDRSTPDHDPHSNAATDDASEPADASMFDIGADESESELSPDSGSEPDPDPESDTGADTDAAVPGGGESGSGFSFGDTASDSGSSSDYDELDIDAEGAEEARADAPFGDLDDLERKEESDEE